MWIETIVMPREEPRPYRPSPRRNRMAVHTAACHEGRAFRDTVMDYLQAHRLMHAVRWISEPGSLPLVTLHCTDRVLEQLQKAPQFEAGRSMSVNVYS